jgi:hypothetical protein
MPDDLEPGVQRSGEAGSQQPSTAGPTPSAAGPNPYAAGPNPYAAGPNPYAAGPSPYGPAYWGQPIAAPRQGRARVHVLWLTVTVIVAILTGSTAYYLGTHHTEQSASARHDSGIALPHTPPPAGSTQCAPTEVAASPDSKLISELIPPPVGSTRPASAATPRAYSLHAYVTQLYGNSAVNHEQALLASRCFQTAVNGEWQTHAGTLVSIWLVQFADNAGARSYALGQQQEDLTLTGAHGRWEHVSGVSDGLLIQDSGLDKYGNSFSRMFGDSGHIMILIHVFVPARWDSEPSMAALLRDQAARI